VSLAIKYLNFDVSRTAKTALSLTQTLPSVEIYCDIDKDGNERGDGLEMMLQRQDIDVGNHLVEFILLITLIWFRLCAFSYPSLSSKWGSKKHYNTGSMF
jgi:hypothetical protein